MAAVAVRRTFALSERQTNSASRETERGKVLNPEYMILRVRIPVGDDVVTQNDRSTCLAP